MAPPPPSGLRSATPHSLPLGKRRQPDRMDERAHKQPGYLRALAVMEAQQVADAMSAAWLKFDRTDNSNEPGLAYCPAFGTVHQRHGALSAAQQDRVYRRR